MFSRAVHYPQSSVRPCRLSSYFGKISDRRSGIEEEVSGGERFQMVLDTVGHSIEIEVNQEAPSKSNFLVLIQSKIIIQKVY